MFKQKVRFRYTKKTSFVGFMCDVKILKIMTIESLDF